jgi:hypothetical protein
MAVGLMSVTDSEELVAFADIGEMMKASWLFFFGWFNTEPVRV